MKKISEMNQSEKIKAVLQQCSKCDINGPEKVACGHCRLSSRYGVYKADLVEALLDGFEPFRGGGKTGRTILTQNQQTKILNDLKQGKSKSSIADGLGVSRGVIYRFLEGLEIEK